MKTRIVVLFAKPYKITDEKTGEIKEGISCSYYLGDDFKIQEGRDGSRGLRPAKCSFDISYWDKFPVAPAYYDADMQMTVDSKGKPCFAVSDLNFACPVRMVAEEKKG